jgi:hypothetical protein
MKQLILIGVILLLSVGIFGCDKKTDSEKLCPYLNIENINKTIPVINNFLASLPSSNSFSLF